MNILGISAYFHDSAAALIVDGDIVAAAQEERFSRKKHDAKFPGNAVAYVLSEAGIGMDGVDAVVFYDKPFLKFERLLETYLALAPRGFASFRRAIPVWVKEKLFLKSLIAKELSGPDAKFPLSKINFSEHHFSHAASAFYPSPFDEAVVLTVDGVGEWTTASVAIGKGASLEITREVHFPHSLGLLYSAVTYYLGFRVNSGEYKVMGLAPYGTPRFAQIMRDNLVRVAEDGSFHLNMEYFEFATGLRMVNRKFADLFGQPVRSPEGDVLTQFHMDMAASIQCVTEEIMLSLTRDLARTYGIPNLCLAGGVALNCVANGKMLRDGAFENIWVQPAAGDAGGAVGAALAYWHHELEQPRVPAAQDAMQGSYLGPAFDGDEIAAELTRVGGRFERVTEDQLIGKVADAISRQEAVGWFQGRAEFGPRALGSRSILGDPRDTNTQRNLNLKIKYRESFRPFAPAVLEEDVASWFDLECESPYMLIVGDVAADHLQPLSKEDHALEGTDQVNARRSSIPAVTHVDNSARVQTVSAQTNPLFHRLISAFKVKTGCPVVVNTSFNVRGEPIVNSPEDAFRCFMGTELDMLAIGDCILIKRDQDPTLKRDYSDEHDLD